MRSRSLRCVAGIAALVGLVAVTGVVPIDAANGDRLKRAVESVRNAQEPSGLLRYDFDFLTGVSSGEDDPVRQAGVIAFLAEYALASGDLSVTPTVTKALERFDALSLPIGKNRMQRFVEWTGLLSVPRGRHKLASILNRLHVLYEPAGEGAVVGLARDYSQASAGATAMALLAELQYTEATRDLRFEPARVRWLQGLAALYVTGHGFRVKPTLIHVSPFADGEGWLALAYFERRQPGHRTVNEILNELEPRLMRQYQASFSIRFYQWGTMAAAVRWNSTKHARFAAFIERQAVHALTWLSEPRRNNTCATLEGLVTAAHVLRDVGGHAALVSRIEQRVSEEMQKNYEFQILPKAGRLDFGNGVAIVSPKLDEFAGAFLHEPYRPYTRIDFTGHCLSVMVKLQRYRGRL